MGFRTEIQRSWNNLPKSARGFLKEWVLPLGLAVVVAFLFRTTIASPRHIPTGSMVPTIKIGEFIFVKMYSYDLHIPFTRHKWIHRNDPQRGDIVVFEYPNDRSKDFIKRVIGIPGDIVEVRNKRVWLNGTALRLDPIEDTDTLLDAGKEYHPDHMSLFREHLGDRSYIVAHSHLRAPRNAGPIEVPEGSFFVIGDNRDDSSDSREWGVVPRDYLLGQGSFIWFSFDRRNFPFLRWNRFFTTLR